MPEPETKMPKPEKTGTLRRQHQEEALAQLEEAAKRAIPDWTARGLLIWMVHYYERRPLSELLGVPETAPPLDIRRAVGASVLAAKKHWKSVRPYSKLSTSGRAYLRQFDRRHLSRSLSEAAIHHQVRLVIERFLTWYCRATREPLGYQEAELEMIEAWLKVAFQCRKLDDQVIGRERIVQIVKEWRKQAKHAAAQRAADGRLTSRSQARPS